MSGGIVWPTLVPPKVLLKTNLRAVSQVLNFERPLLLLNPPQICLLQEKMRILESALADLEKVRTYNDITEVFIRIIKELFPGSASALLLRDMTATYTEITSLNLALPPHLIGYFAGNDSLVKAAGESEPKNRRTVYLPDLHDDVVIMGSRFNRVVGGDVLPNVDQIEQGTIDNCGLKLKVDELARSGWQACAAAPILEYPQYDPEGAVVLAGKADFLHPIMDVIMLRSLADALAQPMARIINPNPQHLIEF